MSLSFLHRYKKPIIVIVHFFIVLSAFFTANVPLSPNMSLVSSLAVFFLFVPAAIALSRGLGLKNTIFLIVFLGGLGIIIETFALKTGIPYGHFSYLSQAGLRIAGLVPITLPFAWTTLIVGTVVLVRDKIKSRYASIFVGTLYLVWLDMVLDPVSVALGFWRWEAGGVYYGVPVINYVGWVISGTMGMGAALILFRLRRIIVDQLPTAAATSLYLFLLFWVGVAGFKMLWIPFVFGCLFIFLNREVFKKSFRELC